MEQRIFWALLLSVTVLILYQQWVRHLYGPRSMPVAPQRRAERGALDSQHSRVEVEAAAPPPALPLSGISDIRVETDCYIAVFTSLGARLKSFRLKRYRNSPDENSGLVEMISSVPGGPYPLGVVLYGSEILDDGTLPYSLQGSHLRLSGDERGTLVFQARALSGETLTKRLTFVGSDYAIGIEILVGGSRRDAPPFLRLTSGEKTVDVVFEGAMALSGNELIRVPPKSLDKSREFTRSFSWAGFGYAYFISVLLPEGMEEQKLLVRRTAIGEEMEIGAPAPADGRSRYTLFIGPKDIDLLRAMGRGLDRAIDLGFFGFISFPFLYVLRLFHRLTGSYGVDIILLTLLVKLLMAPLTHRSFVSMKRMKRLQPQIELLKEKFKKDADRLNKEMTALYRSHHVSPLGGCLPMLLQAPVFMGLYQALRSPIEFRHAPFLWIHDLSHPDWQALPITIAGWSFGIPVLTLLMGASMLTQQWMAPVVEDLDRRRLAMATPLIFTVMFVNFPAGLTVYWLANNLLTIAQQYLISQLDDP